MSSSSKDVIDWILDGLLEGLTLCRDGPTEPTEDGPHFDLCSLIRERDPSQFINSYSTKSLKDGPLVEICQVSCLKQRASGYCGHYALYFSLVMIGLCTTNDRDKVYHNMSLLRNGESFWKRYWQNVRSLLSVVSEDSWWPWTREHVLSGDMERSYLQQLVNFELDNAINGRIHILHYAYGLLQDSVDHVISVQEHLNSFKMAVDSSYLVFTLGVTNHWVTLLAYKVDHTKIGVLYLDSNNEPVLLASAIDVELMVKDRERKHLDRKGFGYTEWKRDTLAQSLCDQRDVVSLLTLCVQSLADLRTEMVNTYWSRLLASYKDHMISATQSCDSYVVMLLNWLENHYSVSVIVDFYVAPLKAVGVSLMSPGIKDAIRSWVLECTTFKSTGLPQIDKFFTLLQELDDLIN